MKTFESHQFPDPLPTLASNLMGLVRREEELLGELSAAALAENEPEVFRIARALAALRSANGGGLRLTLSHIFFPRATRVSSSLFTGDLF